MPGNWRARVGELTTKAGEKTKKVGRWLNGRGPKKEVRNFNEFWNNNQKTLDAINERIKAAEVTAPKPKAVTAALKKLLEKQALKRADSKSGSKKIDERTEQLLGKDYVQGGQGGRDYVAATTAGLEKSTKLFDNDALLERYVLGKNPSLSGQPIALQNAMIAMKRSPEWKAFTDKYGASLEKRMLRQSRRNYYNSNRTTVRSQIRQNSIDKSVQRGEKKIKNANQAEAEAAKAELVQKAELDRLLKVAEEKKALYDTLQKLQAKLDKMRSKTTLGRIRTVAPYAAALGGAGYGAYKLFFDGKTPAPAELTPETLVADPSLYSRRGNTWYTGETPSVAGEVGIDRNGNANYFDGNSWQPIAQLNQDSSGTYYTPDGTAHLGVSFADRAAAAGISNVKGLQQALLNNGYNIGDIDDYFGMATLAAVDAYRRKYGTQGLQNLLILYKKNGGKC